MVDESDRKRRHTLADHLYGADYEHTHDDDSADHDHDHDHDLGPAGPLEENAIWAQDHLTLVSVGIDIGSAGTQVVFSRLRMRRPGEDLSSRYFVVARETLYQSPVAFTPYVGERIDERALGVIIDQAYAAAGLHPDGVDTGSVILTGEALRRENARAIGEVLAEIGGEFVCVTAGHHMEAMLAAYGSGAAKVSHDDGQRILNVDIGGGTTKLAMIEDGRVHAIGALHLGGRLVVVDEQHRIARLDPAGAYLARQSGFDWQIGAAIDPAALDRVAEWMADALMRVLVGGASAEHAELHLTGPVPELARIDGVMFSGGVGEYVYGRESRDFNDLGRRFGLALGRRIEAGDLPWPLLPAGECIRATALGASEYSVQLSGNTVYVSDPAVLLPRRNLPALRPPVRFDEVVDAAQIAAAIGDHFAAFDLVEGEATVALAFRWHGEPSYDRIAALARGILLGLPRTLDTGAPIYLVLDGDIAQTLGAILKEDWNIPSAVLAIDGIALRDFDYVDLGRIRMPSFTVPVTIKSLVFRLDPRAPHHHDPAHHSARFHSAGVARE